MNKKSSLHSSPWRHVRRLCSKEHQHVVDSMDRHYGGRAVSRRSARSVGATGARGGSARRGIAANWLRPLIWQMRVRWRQLRRGLALLNPVMRHAQGLAALGLLLIQLVMSVSTMWIDHAMAQHQSTVAAEVARIENDRDRLAVAATQAADPAYVQVRARDVLHYVQPGEQLVLLADAAPLTDTASPPWWFYE
jgi:cell division protein FtsB